MWFHSNSRSRLLTFGFAVSFGLPSSPMSSPDRNLLASIKATSVQSNVERYEMISFHLENKSPDAVECRPETWIIMVDGKELADSGLIFGNGPSPVGGYGSLPAGTSFDFAKGLDIVRYFPDFKEHSVQWRAAGFTSNIFRFRTSAPH